MNISNLQEYKNPPGFEIDFDILREFETDLDPQSPESCRIPCHVLGYGEISTVFELNLEEMDGLAFKRMSVFESQDELFHYLSTYQEYNHLLEKAIGLNLPPHGHAIVRSQTDRPIFYIIQVKVPAHTIGNKAIHLLTRDGILTLFERVLQESHKVWSFNQEHKDCQVAIDGQISNWVLDDFDLAHPQLDEGSPLSYVDTSTPFLRSNGDEQLNPELFLRAAPSFLAWILRTFFLEDVMNRYYDPRQVVIDLLANFYKEQRPDLIPDLIFAARSFFADQAPDLTVRPIEEKEIRDYYREDAFIWSLYLTSRRIDRVLYKYLYRCEYPYILPGRIKR